jgi:hypothetical protein
MLDKLAAIFGFSGVADSALKIVDKLAGVDWTAKEKAQYVLDYQNATKHQSPARRFIAMSIMVVWVILILSWLAGSMIGRFYLDGTLNAGTVFAADVSAFVALNITDPFNIILAFYFTTQILNGLKK